MKLEKVTNKETNVVELEISVPADEFEKAVEKSYRKNVKKLSVPGFRKGKAPRKMVERMYGAGVFYDDAMEEVYPEAYKAAVDEAKIEPVDRANVEILEVGENGFRFNDAVLRHLTVKTKHAETAPSPMMKVVEKEEAKKAAVAARTNSKASHKSDDASDEAADEESDVQDAE